MQTLLIISSIFIISDIYFIGGFGTVAWVDVSEYESLQPDKIAIDGGENNLKVRFLILQTYPRDLHQAQGLSPPVHAEKISFFFFSFSWVYIPEIV